MATDMFLKIDGIEGESSDKAHPGEIEVLSYSWGVSQPLSSSASSAGSLTAGRADFQPLTIVKAIDKATPLLMQHCADGKHLKNIRLELCRSGEDKQPYMKYTFTDVVISALQPGGSGGNGGEALPVESVSFAYGKAEWEYTQTKVTGGKGSGSVAGGWDLQANAKV